MNNARLAVLQGDENSFSVNQKKMAFMLVDDPVFQSTVKLFREFIQIPPQGFNLDTIEENLVKDNRIDEKYIYELGEALERVRQDKMKVRVIVHMLLAMYDLPHTWIRPIGSYLLQSKFLPPSNPIQIRLNEVTEPADNLTLGKANRKTVLIAINEQMSVTMLTELLKKDDNLKNYLSELPKLGRELDLSKIQNTDKKSAMLNLKKSKVSLSGIEKNLPQLFDDTLSFALSRSQVSTYLGRYQETLSRLVDKGSVVYQIYEALVKKDHEAIKRLRVNLKYEV